MAKWALDPAGMAVVGRLQERPSAELIEALGAMGQVAAIPYLTKMIREKDTELRKATLRSIDRLLRLLRPTDLRRLDQEIRTRWVYSSWAPTLKPKHVGKLVMKYDYPLAAAAICSMHRSGFIREEAVRRLAALRTGEELPYLLIRAADWVEPVREVATQSIRDRLVVDYVPVLIDNLVLLEGESFETGRAAALTPAIERLLSSGEALPQLLQAVSHPDRGVRRAASRRALHAGSDALDLLEAALDQDDVIVAGVIAESAIEQAAEGERDALLQRLSTHPFGRIRQLALTARLRLFPDSATDVLGRALFDRQAGVRDVAQGALAKEGVDVAQRYREALGVDPFISLMGLGESGIKRDAGLAVPFLTAAETRVRRAAVRVISNLDPAPHRGHLLQAFTDASPGVSRAATLGLERAGASAIADALWAVMRSTQLDHHRTYAVMLLTHADRWTMLRIGLQALLEPSEDVKRAGHRLVSICMQTWNKSFTSPPPGAVTELLPTLEKCRPWLTPAEMHDIGFTLRSFDRPSELAEEPP
jgi:HEAT repeat protein